MPTYDYRCENCGKQFEVFHAMSEEPSLKCSECNGNLKRLIGTGSGVLMKDSDSGFKSNRDINGCSLEHTGQTCCGRTSRCNSAPCETQF